ncbi:MAG: four helix bundle protein [Thermoflexibacter sp.]|jgi:four helix bundle protein|nr:four helix bundle protein [Thermoflexibacter sp.]
MNQIEFNELFKRKTKTLAVKIVKLYGEIPKTDENQIIGKQLLRSATSTAANYRAVCRARSEAERYSKLSIVVEEADETLFWIEILEETGILTKEKLVDLKKEATEIIAVMAKTRKNLKDKRDKNKTKE